MPELPEVETVRLGLNQLTLNQNICGGEVLLERSIASPVSVAAFLAGLKGKRFVQWLRRGKYLYAELENVEGDTFGGWLGVHLRMTGQLLWVNRDELLHKHTRIRLFLVGNQELRFVDQRTFGQMWWVPPELKVEEVITGLKVLGTEPLSEDFSREYLAQRLRKGQRSIKTALLDQAIAPGIGNIYADEALFVGGIHPLTLCSQLTLDQVERLRESVVSVLQASLQQGGTTFSNFLNVKGINGNYGGVAWVYNRTGEGCRVCQTPIERIKLGGRSTHFCPRCQPIVGNLHLG